MHATTAPAQTPPAPQAHKPSRRNVALAVAACTLTVVAGLVRWPFESASVHPESQQYTLREAPTEPLAEIFHSYDSVDAVVAALADRGYRAEHKSSHLSQSRRYPPRDLDTLEVAGYLHLGCFGQLDLEFFNGRLYQARFEPADIRAFLKKLHAAKLPLERDGVGRSERTVGNLRIATDIDLANSRVGRYVDAKPYLLWQDLRLKRQLAEWESRYGPESSLPN